MVIPTVPALASNGSEVIIYYFNSEGWETVYYDVLWEGIDINTNYVYRETRVWSDMPIPMIELGDGWWYAKMPSFTNYIECKEHIAFYNLIGGGTELFDLKPGDNFFNYFGKMSKGPVSSSSTDLIKASYIDYVYDRKNWIKSNDYWVNIDGEKAQELIYGANSGEANESFIFMYCHSNDYCGITTIAIPRLYMYAQETKTKLYVFDNEEDTGYIPIYGWKGWQGIDSSSNSFWTPLFFAYNSETQQRMGREGGDYLNFIEVIYLAGLYVPNVDSNGVWLSEDGKTLRSYFGKSENVIIPNGVTAIEDDAFNGKEKVKSVVIPDTVEIIGSMAFLDCDGLTNIVIPANVRSIGNSFAECNNLTNVYFKGGAPDIHVDAFYNTSADLSFTVPDNDPSWDGFTYEYLCLVNKGSEQLNYRSVKIVRGLPDSVKYATELDLSTPPPVPNALTVDPTPSTVYVDGAATQFEAYLINGENYFKLRDLAYALRGTEKRFAIGWDSASGAATMTSGQKYEPIGGEMAQGNGSAKFASLNTGFNISKDGAKVELNTYLIGGNNFVRLRDVMRLFNICVTYDVPTKNIGIDTSQPYSE